MSSPFERYEKDNPKHWNCLYDILRGNGKTLLGGFVAYVVDASASRWKSAAHI